MGWGLFPMMFVREVLGNYYRTKLIHAMKVRCFFGACALLGCVLVETPEETN